MHRSLHAALSCLVALASSAAFATNFTISLRSEAGLYVVAENGGGQELRANRPQRGPWEAFTLYDTNGEALRSGDSVVLRAVNGRFVAAEGGGWGQLVANRELALSWETFTIERLDGSTADIDDGAIIGLRAVNGALISASNGELRADGKAMVRFRLGVIGRFARGGLSSPLARPWDYDGPIGVDHDLRDVVAPSACEGFYGSNFPRCYDQHEGTDFMLRSWFPGMDLGTNEVLAAKAGVVLDIADGNVDHCFAFPQPGAQYQVVCPGATKLVANMVKVLQDDGDVALYYHLKVGSVAVQKGQHVDCGQVLGHVGSSGVSSSPHLHFGFQRDRADVDPYALGAWAQLSNRIPQRTCSPSASRACQVVTQVFDCKSEPAQSICDGVQVVSGGCVVPDFHGGCAKTCADLCSAVTTVVTQPCP